MADDVRFEGVQHHYMRGLCFDSLWSYQTRSRSGRAVCSYLDLGADAYPWSQEDDPEGAGWCVRCCASVLSQRLVSLTHVQHVAIPTGEPASLVSVLHQLLPKCEIDVRHTIDKTAMAEILNVIGSGGGVLARMERQHQLRQILPYWVWIVGVETKPVPLCLSGMQTQALLMVGRELSPPWTSGYGAKARLVGIGEWMIRSVDGQAWSGAFSSMICLRPR